MRLIPTYEHELSPLTWYQTAEHTNAVGSTKNTSSTHCLGRNRTSYRKETVTSLSRLTIRACIHNHLIELIGQLDIQFVVVAKKS